MKIKDSSRLNAIFSIFKEVCSKAVKSNENKEFGPNTNFFKSGYMVADWGCSSAKTMQTVYD
jgi:hypothetical protein